MMVIGSSGGTLVDQVGDLSSTSDKRLEAKGPPGDPFDAHGRGSRRWLILPRPIRPFAKRSVRALRCSHLKTIGKVVKLALRRCPLIVKLVIGDHLWLQHYHGSRMFRTCQVCLLQRNHEAGACIPSMPISAQRWESPESCRGVRSGY